MSVTQEDLQKLPPWAIVAFAARCARRAQPLFGEAWPATPKEYTRAVSNAIDSAEHPTFNSAYFENAAEAAEAAANAIANPISEAVAYAAAEAARAAGYASRRDVVFAGTPIGRADLASVANAATNAANSARGASASSESNDAIHAAQQADYDRLLAAATRENWTDDTPVPAEFFGPLWPDGEPEGWSKVEEPPIEQENVFDAVEPLTLLIDPGTATPEQIGTLLAEISKLYKMVGGSGIDFTLTDVFETQEVLA